MRSEEEIIRRILELDNRNLMGENKDGAEYFPQRQALEWALADSSGKNREKWARELQDIRLHLKRNNKRFLGINLDRLEVLQKEIYDLSEGQDS